VVSTLTVCIEWNCARACFCSTKNGRAAKKLYDEAVLAEKKLGYHEPGLSTSARLPRLRLRRCLREKD